MQFETLLSSGLEFEDHEEYLAFRFRLLNAVMLVTIGALLVFVFLDFAHVNTLGPWQLLASELHCVVTIGLMTALHGRKHLYTLVSTAFATVCLLVFFSALFSVPKDELRIVWFYIHIGVVYILLGQRLGIIMSFAVLAGIIVANPWLAHPLSTNAMSTALISLTATSCIFYAYTSRAISYFERMTENNRELRELASKDALTGILNPRAFYEISNRLIRLAQRTGKTYSVLFVDLDSFKSVNDRYGHQAGDSVLRTVGQCLSRQMRRSDVLGRVGGEEFSVFLPDTNIEGATLLADKLRKSLEQQEFELQDGTCLRVTASVGVTQNQPPDRSIADIQGRADRAMYRAKEQGRNRVVVVEQ